MKKIRSESIAVIVVYISNLYSNLDDNHSDEELAKSEGDHEKGIEANME